MKRRRVLVLCRVIRMRRRVLTLVLRPLADVADVAVERVVLLSILRLLLTRFLRAVRVAQRPSISMEWITASSRCRMLRCVTTRS